MTQRISKTASVPTMHNILPRTQEGRLLCEAWRKQRFSFIECDYSAVEARVLAMSKDSGK